MYILKFTYLTDGCIDGSYKDELEQRESKLAKEVKKFNIKVEEVSGKVMFGLISSYLKFT